MQCQRGPRPRSKHSPCSASPVSGMSASPRLTDPPPFAQTPKRCNPVHTRDPTLAMPALRFLHLEIRFHNLQTAKCWHGTPGVWERLQPPDGLVLSPSLDPVFVTRNATDYCGR